MSGLFQIWMERFQAMRIGPSPRRGGPAGRTLLRPMILTSLLCLALAGTAAHSWAQQPDGAEDSEAGMDENSMRKKKAEEKKPGEILPPPAGVVFSTRLDHTAVWLGDQFHYFITVDYTPEFEFVLDSLTKETVNMEPLQVMGVDKATTDMKNKGKRLVVDMTLTNFGTGQTSMKIPQFTLYYFRKANKATSVEQAAAESLTIPGPVIGLRSTLPPEPADIRDSQTVESWARSRWTLPVVGWAAAIVLVIGLGFEGVGYVKSRKARKGPDPRKAMEAIRSRWASHVPSDFSDVAKAKEFYNHSYQDVKEFVGYYLDTPLLGLTSEELQDEMQRLGSSPDLTRRVVKVLGACESLLYSPNGTADQSDAARGVAQDVREIMNTKI